MNIPLKVHAVISDPNTEAQIVILRDEQSMDLLPIWVGVTEGNAIRFALEGLVASRPMTHDLLRDFLSHLDVVLEKVLIHDMNEGTYFASLHLTQNQRNEQVDEAPLDISAFSQDLTIDARPSDAIALALRMGVPIYATEAVIQKKSSENLDAWLEKLKPKDFGSYEA